MASRVTLLGMDKVRELGGISKEEDRRIVRHHIPVALFSPEFDRESSRVSSTVVRAGLATDGREADCDGAFLALLAEDVGNTKIVEGLCASEGTVSTATLGVDDPLGNPFTVEMGEKVDQMEILEEKWPISAYTLGLVWMGHRNAIAGSVKNLLGGGVSVVFVTSEDARAGRVT